MQSAEETYKQARDVYEKLVNEENATTQHLSEVRERRLRQEGYLAALELVLRGEVVPTTGQEAVNGEEEALDAGSARVNGKAGNGGQPARRARRAQGPEDTRSEVAVGAAEQEPGPA